MKKCLLGCLIAVMFIGMLLIGGCNKNPQEIKKEDKGFYYYLIDKNGDVASLFNKDGAAILGLVDSEEEIDELVIPEKLGGYTVKQVGAYYTAGIGAGWHSYGINAKNIKRIVINHELFILDSGFQDFEGDFILYAPVNFDVGLPPYNSNSIQFNYPIENSEYEFILKELSKRKITYKLIKFDTDGGQQETYASVIKEGNLITIPKSPTKEGYTFDGWYKEDSYETQWNFETDTVTENITLYAKWI